MMFMFVIVINLYIFYLLLWIHYDISIPDFAILVLFDYLFY